MKQLLTLIFLLTTTFSLYSQKLDVGFSKLKINTSVPTVSKYLTATTSDKLWNKRAEDLNGGYFETKGYLFNFALAGVKTYYGMQIERVEVYSINEEDEDGNFKEKISSFCIYMKPVEDPDEILLNMMADFGDASIWINASNDDLMGADWFTSKTLLRMQYGYNVATEEKQEWFMAEYINAAGG